MAEEAPLPHVRQKAQDGKQLGSQHSLQGHTSNDVTSIH